MPGTKTLIASSSPANPLTASNWTGSSALANGDTAVCENTVQQISGADQSAVTLALLEIMASFGQGARIGNPPADGAPGTPWKIGATLCNIGRKTGGGGNEVGSDQIMLHFHTIKTLLTIYSTSMVSSMAKFGLPPVLIAGSHADNVFNIIEGWVGIAMNGYADTAQFATMNMGKVGGGDNGCRVRMGIGVTWGAIVKHSGELLIQSAGTSFTQEAGKTVKEGDGDIGTANIYGGVFVPNGGDITTLEVQPGAYVDFTQSKATREVDTLIFNGPSSDWKKHIIYDPTYVTIPEPTTKGIVGGAQGIPFGR